MPNRRAPALKRSPEPPKDGLPLSVLIAPDADVLADAVDEAEPWWTLLGTGFSGGEVREPYAGWIRAANRRRFEGKRGKGRGRHRKRTHERGEHERPRRSLPAKAKDAPFAVAADVPAASRRKPEPRRGRRSPPMLPVTMLAYKPGLVLSRRPWVGAVKLAKARRGRVSTWKPKAGVKKPPAGWGTRGGYAALHRGRRGESAHAHGQIRFERVSEGGGSQRRDDGHSDRLSKPLFRLARTRVPARCGDATIRSRVR